MASRIDRADNGLLDENFDRLNKDFYDAKPWVYFDRRLVHVARLAADPGAYRDSLSTAVRLGPMEVSEVAATTSDDQPVGLDDQSFTAAEGQVMLHHTAETLLRLIHAHAPDAAGFVPPCAWLTMSRIKNPRQFKRWVEERINSASADETRKLVTDTFAGVLSDTEQADVVVAHIRLCAEHFLDADSYNAAKHGFAVRGARSRLNVDVASSVSMETDGLTIEWLGVRGGEPRWARTTRWFSVEATIALSFFAIRLIEALWSAARHRYLGEPIDVELAVPAPDELFAAFGVPHHILTEMDEELEYEGAKPTLRVRMRVRR